MKLLYVLLFVFFFFSLAAYVNAATDTTAPCPTDKTTFSSASGLPFNCKEVTPSLLAEYMIQLNYFFFRLAIALAAFMILLGGFQWMMAIGNASKISNAKETIEQAVIGLILALCATLLFSQIDQSFVKLKSLTLQKGTRALECKELLDDDSCTNYAGAQCRWYCAGGFKTVKQGSVTKEDRSQCLTAGVRPTCTSGTADKRCEDFGPTSACDSQPGCVLMTTNGFTQCRSRWSNARCGYSKTKAQALYNESQYTHVSCCMFKSSNGTTQYQWAAKLFGVGTDCASICTGGGGWSDTYGTDFTACWRDAVNGSE